MTKFQKQMLTIAAAGALTAVTALPAMAFENEFHGIFNFNTVLSNYNTGSNGDVNPGSSTTNWGDKRKMNNYFEQRTRILYTAKASDDLKLVTGFEMNTRFGNAGLTNAVNGASSYSTSTYTVNGGGGRIDTDTTNIVTKWAYLDFNVGKNFNAKLGQMPYKDTIKGLLVDADMPMILTTTKLGNYTLGLGYSRFADDSANAGTPTTSRLGDANKDLFVLDNTFALSKDTKVAFSYYLLADYASSYNGNVASTATNTSAAILSGHTSQQALQLHTFGLSGETKIGALNLSGFAAMQAGNQRDWVTHTGSNATSRNFHGWAANVAANMKIGSGTAKTAFLYTSGSNNTNPAQYNGWISTSVNSYNESGMMILARNTGNSPTSTDQYIRRDVTNIALATLGYDAMLTDKVSLNGNVGFGWAPASNGAPNDNALGANRPNASDFMGTEINLEAGYQLYKNLKVLAQGGYMILGGYYKNSAYKNNGLTTTANAVDPENPYTMRLQARYSF
ncbi:MAG: hypothetical protein LWW87_07725 [Geobacteraceae bacterium]|nr:hypothetical protein [Geobacteraceae bacterium]